MPPIYYNGIEVQSAYYNGKVTSAYYNGILVWGKQPEPVYTITLLSDGNGTLVSDTVTGHPGDVVTLTNTPNARYITNGYDTTGCTVSNDTVVLEGNCTVKSKYKGPYYKITTQNDGNGALTYSIADADKYGTNSAIKNAVVSLTQTPNARYINSSINVTGGTVASNKITMSADTTAKATFKGPYYKVTTQNDGHGTLTFSIPTSGIYGTNSALKNTVVTLTQTPSTRYINSSINVTGGTVASNKITMSADTTAKGTFRGPFYKVTTQNDGHGTCTYTIPSANKYGNDSALSGTSITLTTSYNTYYRFNTYSVTGCTVASNAFKISADSTAKATYKVNSWKCTGTLQGGKIISTANSGMYYTDVYFKPTSNTGTVPTVNRTTYPYSKYQFTTAASSTAASSCPGLTANYLNLPINTSAVYCKASLTGKGVHMYLSNSNSADLSIYVWASANMGYTSAYSGKWNSWFTETCATSSINVTPGFSANKIASGNYPRMILTALGCPQTRASNIYPWYATGCCQFTAVGGTFTASGISP